MLPLIYSMLSVLVISLISILAIYWIISQIPTFTRYILPMVSLAVGSLLGDAFIHLLPEANEKIANSSTVSLLVILGILIFFSIEKFVRWHHCHDPDCEQDSSPIVTISLAGEIFHNFIDGVVIAGSFLVDTRLGLATALAVLIHEIPQEIGHFSIYIHQGLNLLNSLKLNLLAAVSSFLGVILTILIGSNLTQLSLYILPITAGGFIYLAASDLIPELHRQPAHTNNGVTQIIFLLLGVFLMYSLLWLD